MSDPRTHPQSLHDGLDEAELAAVYGHGPAEATVPRRRKLSREESQALLEDLWGPLPEDALAWARRVLGADDRAAS